MRTIVITGNDAEARERVLREKLAIFQPQVVCIRKDVLLHSMFGTEDCTEHQLGVYNVALYAMARELVTSGFNLIVEGKGITATEMKYWDVVGDPVGAKFEKVIVR